MHESDGARDLRSGRLSVGLVSGLASYLVLFGTLFAVPYFLAAEGVGAALIGLQLAVLPVAIGIPRLSQGGCSIGSAFVR